MMAYFAKGSYAYEYPPLFPDAAHVPADACELCEDEGTVICSRCNGSGEVMHEGAMCHTCKGNGEVPCECQADRLQDEADAKDAAAEAKYDARRDGE